MTDSCRPEGRTGCPDDAGENCEECGLPQVGRRSFLKLISWVLIAPAIPSSCGIIPGATVETTVNSLLLHLIGMEDHGINLLNEIRKSNDESFDLACFELLDHISSKYQTASGIDFLSFVDDLNAGTMSDSEDIFYLVEILKANAVMVFYASSDGFALAGYDRHPFKRTYIHSFLREWTYPNCYTPCHSSKSCYSACHPHKEWQSGLDGAARGPGGK